MFYSGGLSPDFAIKVWVSKVRGNNVRQSNLYYYITFGAKKSVYYNFLSDWMFCIIPKTWI